MVIDAAEGQDPRTMLQELTNPDCVLSIGKNLRKFHEASKQYVKEYPEESAKVPDWRTMMDGFMMKYRRENS